MIDTFEGVAAYNPGMLIPSLAHPLPQHQLLMRLFWMRCVATLIQALLVAGAGMHLHLPLLQLSTVLGLMLAFNGFTLWRTRNAGPVCEPELFLQLFIDVSALSALLYFTGGATNPFVSFYLPALAVAAAILSTPYAIALSVYALFCYSWLTYFYQALQLHDMDQGMAYHLAGMWLNFLVSAALITWCVTRMSATLRSSDARLAQARELQLQNAHIVALGTQAASAAHEMSTPLATVALIAGELRIEAAQNPALAMYRGDLTIVEEQIALCKKALNRMAMEVETAQAEVVTTIGLSAWLKNFIDAWRWHYPALSMRLSLPEQFMPVRDAQWLGQIISTLLDNAAQAVGGHGQVDVTLRLQPGEASIDISDHGPGIDVKLLQRLGYEPVRSSTGGKGIGLMLAFASARQIGARLALSAPSGQGVSAVLTLPMDTAADTAVAAPATASIAAPPIYAAPVAVVTAGAPE